MCIWNQQKIVISQNVKKKMKTWTLVLQIIAATSRPLCLCQAFVLNSTTGWQAPGIPATTAWTVFLTIAVVFAASPWTLCPGPGSVRGHIHICGIHLRITAYYCVLFRIVQSKLTRSSKFVKLNMIYRNDSDCQIYFWRAQSFTSPI